MVNKAIRLFPLARMGNLAPVMVLVEFDGKKQLQKVPYTTNASDGFWSDQ